jgi:hypothetical protein
MVLVEVRLECGSQSHPDSCVAMIRRNRPNEMAVAKGITHYNFDRVVSTSAVERGGHSDPG